MMSQQQICRTRNTISTHHLSSTHGFPGSHANGTDVATRGMELKTGVKKASWDPTNQGWLSMKAFGGKIGKGVLGIYVGKSRMMSFEEVRNIWFFQRFLQFHMFDNMFVSMGN